MALRVYVTPDVYQESNQGLLTSLIYDFVDIWPMESLPIHPPANHRYHFLLIVGNNTVNGYCSTFAALRASIGKHLAGLLTEETWRRKTFETLWPILLPSADVQQMAHLSIPDQKLECLRLLQGQSLAKLGEIIAGCFARQFSVGLRVAVVSCKRPSAAMSMSVPEAKRARTVQEGATR